MTMEPQFTYRATVGRWVDGDTCWLSVDLGFHVATLTDFRLYGIDTPERGKPGYSEATAEVNALAPAGSAVTVRTHKAPDKYGRWLAEIFTPDGGDLSINDTLLSLNLAVPYLGGKKP